MCRLPSSWQQCMSPAHADCGCVVTSVVHFTPVDKKYLPTAAPLFNTCHTVITLIRCCTGGICSGVNKQHGLFVYSIFSFSFHCLLFVHFFSVWWESSMSNYACHSGIFKKKKKNFWLYSSENQSLGLLTSLTTGSQCCFCWLSTAPDNARLKKKKTSQFWVSFCHIGSFYFLCPQQFDLNLDLEV